MATPNIGPTLYHYVDARRWGDVISRASSHPLETLYVDNGWPVLQKACFWGAPIGVIGAILSAFPESALKQDERGATPLHYASLRSSPEVVSMLVRACADVINVKGKCGATPLTWLCSFYKVEIDGILSKHLLPGQNTYDLINSNTGAAFIWKKACLLVKAAYHGTVAENLPDGKQFRVIHACAALDCPSNLLQLAMKLHPEQLLDADEGGNCPLHVAAAAPITSNNKSAIGLLLEANYVVARKKNLEFKLPLRLALETKKIWSKGIKELFEAFPSALFDERIDDRFYPVILSFVGRTSALSASYNLLRGKPELIIGAE